MNSQSIFPVACFWALSDIPVYIVMLIEPAKSTVSKMVDKKVCEEFHV